MNPVRGYHFLPGVFRSQRKNPYCSVCSGYANTLNEARENLAVIEARNAADLAGLVLQFMGLPAGMRTGLASLPAPVNPSGRKKAGNCKLPSDVCFIKDSFALVKQI